MGGLCEYMDAGGGIALARVDDAGAGAQLTVSARGAEMAFSLVSDTTADGKRTVTFAGPLYMLDEADACATLHGPDGEMRLAVQAVERIGDFGEGCDADAAGELEALRIRCAASERALAVMRADAGAESPRLVKAWSESAELREALSLREDVHREARRDARTLRRRVAELEQELERLERYATRLEGSVDEHERAYERMRSERDFVRYSLREAKRRDLRRQAEAELLRREVERERSHRDFARHSLREGKRRELELRREIETSGHDAITVLPGGRPEAPAVSGGRAARRRRRRIRR